MEHFGNKKISVDRQEILPNSVIMNFADPLYSGTRLQRSRL
jgi:hypothetical protein